MYTSPDIGVFRGGYVLKPPQKIFLLLQIFNSRKIV